MSADVEMVARRLRAIKQEFEEDLRTDDQFARLVGAQRTAVSNWMNGRLLPPVHYMVTLKNRTHITLDWIYTGDTAAMPMALAIRLEGYVSGLSVPTSSPEPPETPMRAPVRRPHARSPSAKKAASHRGQKMRQT